MSCLSCAKDVPTTKTADGCDICDDCWQDIFTCDHCGGDFWQLEDKGLCSDCYDKLIVRCPSCKKEFNKDDEGKEQDGEWYCSECFGDIFAECNKCGYVFKKDDMKEAFGDLYCEDCFDEDFVVCCECDKVVEQDDGRTQGADIYCDSCWNEHFFCCEECGESFPNEDAIEDCDCFYCSDCVPRRRMIHEQSYKPNPEFLGQKGPFFGVELEVADYEDEGLSDKAEALLEKIGHFAYLKDDCSIDNCGHEGFEIVTHPMSWDWMKTHEKDLDHIFDLSKKGFRSYVTNSCGMHVHVSKRDLSNLQVFKLVTFFLENRDFVYRISQRQENQFNSWAAVNFYYSPIEIAKRKFDDSRGALNLGPRNTVEFRIFRGTLDKTAFYRNLEFVSAMLEFSKQFGLKDMKAEKFFEFVRLRRGSYSRLFRFIIDKITKKRMFKESEDIKAIAKREVEKREKYTSSLTEIIGSGPIGVGVSGSGESV